MLIDTCYFLMLLYAVYKGYTKGLIVAVFSFLGFIIGIAAAIKFSVIVANHLKHFTHVNVTWLPFLSFLIVMICVVALIKLSANIVQKTFEMLLLGWVNKFGGIALYAIISTMALSVILFYCVQIKLVSAAAINESKTYFFIKPWSPIAINGLGKLFPIFREMFTELEGYFDAAARNLQ